MPSSLKRVRGASPGPANCLVRRRTWGVKSTGNADEYPLRSKNRRPCVATLSRSGLTPMPQIRQRTCRSPVGLPVERASIWALMSRPRSKGTRAYGELLRWTLADCRSANGMWRDVPESARTSIHRRGLQNTERQTSVLPLTWLDDAVRTFLFGVDRATRPVRGA